MQGGKCNKPRPHLASSVKWRSRPPAPSVLSLAACDNALPPRAVCTGEALVRTHLSRGGNSLRSVQARSAQWIAQACSQVLQMYTKEKERAPCARDSQSAAGKTFRRTINTRSATGKTVRHALNTRNATGKTVRHAMLKGTQQKDSDGVKTIGVVSQ